jgi:hypothetical protein
MAGVWVIQHRKLVICGWRNAVWPFNTVHLLRPKRSAAKLTLFLYLTGISRPWKMHYLER